tara:strand:- start:5352 stop:7679 length:2328 start_codon:yes stop_codon:yes gene_type:complete
MTHNTDVSSIQQEAAELYLADWATPIPVNPNDKRPIGSGWENTKYNNIDEVYSVFSNHRGNMGALLKDDVVCIDLDALNISKEVEVYRSGKKQKVCFGLELLEAVLDHKFETNVIGRHTKPIGGVFVKSDFPMKRNNEDKLRPSIRADYTFQNEAFIKQNNSKAGTVETLHVGTQKLVSPSIYDGEEFVWRKPPSEELPFFSHDKILEACRYLHLLSIFSFAYPSAGGRDKGMRDLTNLLGHSREADNPKHVSRFLNILSSNSGDGDERGDKDWSDLITNAKDMKFPSFETMQRYFDKLETKDLKQLYKFLGVTTPKEEKEERAEMPLVMLNTTKASELRPENILARDILIKNLWQRGCYSHIVGTGGSLKSLSLMQLGILASNGDGFWLPQFKLDRPLKILYINNEDNADELNRRCYGIIDGLNRLDEKNKGKTYNLDNFEYQSTLEDQLYFAHKSNENAIPKINTKQVAHFKEYLFDNQFDGLMLDPIVSFHNLNENNNGEMEFFIKKGIIAPFCVGANVGVMGGHHTSKGSTNNGDEIEDNTNASRGASAITNAARSVLRFAPMNKQSAKQTFGNKPEDLIKRHNYINVAFGKANNWATQDGDWLEKKIVKYAGMNGFEIDTVIGVYDPAIRDIKEKNDKEKFEQDTKLRDRVIDTLDHANMIEWNENKSYIFIPDVAKALEEHNLEFCLDVNQQFGSFAKKGYTKSDGYQMTVAQMSNYLSGLFKTKAVKHGKQILFYNGQRGGGNRTRWLEIAPMEDNVVQLNPTGNSNE